MNEVRKTIRIHVQHLSTRLITRRIDVINRRIPTRRSNDPSPSGVEPRLPSSSFGMQNIYKPIAVNIGEPDTIILT